MDAAVGDAVIVMDADLQGGSRSGGEVEGRFRDRLCPPGQA
jgi:hypothetical protein